LLLVDSLPFMNRARLILPVVLLVALAGCGGSDPEPAAQPSPSATSASPTPTSASPSPSPSSAAPIPSPPVDGGKFANPLRLIEALRKGGIDCTGYEAVANPTGAIARGSCYVAGEEYTIGIYKSEAQAREQPNAMAELLDGVAEVNLVLGLNWTVGCPDRAACQLVAGVLGGEVFHEDV